MKYLPLITVLILSACAGAQSPSGEEHTLRSATPGVVDHNVIPRK